MERRNVLRIATLGGTIALVGCNVPESESSSVPEPRGAETVELLEHSAYVDDVSGGVSGTVRNATERVLNYVVVEVTFIDGNEQAIYVGDANVARFNPGEERTFDVRFQGSDWNAVVEYTVRIIVTGDRIID